MHTTSKDGVAGIKQRRHNLSSDDVRNLATASGRGRLKRESRIIYVATASGLQSDAGLESVRYGVSNILDMAYWGFLGVETTFDIFQNIHILYFQYNVLVFSGYGVLILFPLWSFGECRHRYAVSSLMDTAYWLSEQ
ncbi:hypothetical protein Tco_0033399 [Tanacetum coccineum]